MADRTIDRWIYGLSAASVGAFIALAAAGQKENLADVLLLGTLPLAFTGAGAVALLKRPAHRAARRITILGTTHLAAFSLAVVVVSDPAHPVSWILNLVSMMLFALGMAAWVAACAVFPDGRYTGVLSRHLVRGYTSLVAALSISVGLLGPDVKPVVLLGDDPPSIETPLGTEALRLLGPIAAIIINLGLLVGVVLLVLRYLRGDKARKLAMRWPLVSAIVLGAAVIGAPFGSLVFPDAVVTIAFVVIGISFPATLALAMLRHRLFDVDLVIRRSLIYGVLWVFISAIYAAVTSLLGISVGARAPVGLAVVVTAVMAVTLQPLRSRLENIADRWVFGRRASRYDLLSSFGASLKRTFDVDSLVQELVATARAGAQARWVRLWLVDPDRKGLTPRHAEGLSLMEEDFAPLVVPLADAEAAVGFIECGPRIDGSYSTTDAELLQTLAYQATLALRNATLAADLAARVFELDRQTRELAASRARLVHAQETERRRIERDIHDGIQQQLVAMMAKLELTQTQLPWDLDKARHSLEEAQHSVRSSLADLRDLVAGIHPAVLRDQGLAEATKALAARCPLEIDLCIAARVENMRLPADVESAAYFTIAEGLTNAVKHSQGARVVLDLALVPDGLAVEISDNGCGFQSGGKAGGGIEGLQDRVEALGGRIDVESEPGTGVRIRAHFPLRDNENV